MSENENPTQNEEKKEECTKVVTAKVTEVATKAQECANALEGLKQVPACAQAMATMMAK